eukprot:CAMPEP_0113993180 /NCGR_PEP_ID=MMETSP0328-20130328/10001_1 /TAXON_ID=39455 /ORGANISM="Alexandrium minutum" /LENGTH=41 /assembly_acc=CAM_ASM_000350
MCQRLSSPHRRPQRRQAHRPRRAQAARAHGDVGVRLEAAAE